MIPELGEFALSLVLDLIKSVIQDIVKDAGKDFFERRKINNRIENATAEVVEPLLPFLTHEGLTEEQQRILIHTCVNELRPLTQDPERLLQGSLSGQKIFDDLYKERPLPQEVLEGGLKEIYTLLFPRIATVLCKIPEAVKGWEVECWVENYRRLDEITVQMRSLFQNVDALAGRPSKVSDDTLRMTRRTTNQKIRLEMDLTGLRSDRPMSGSLDDFFVHPKIIEIIENADSIKTKPIEFQTEQDSLDYFLRAGIYSILIGPPGSGKSTWAKWFQREILSTKWNGLGIRIELRQFSNKELPTLYELIRESVSKQLLEDLTIDVIRGWLESQLIIFVFDGFDEVKPEDRDRVLDSIEDLRSISRGCSFILTSRPLTTDHLKRLEKTWKSWAIAEFEKERIIMYIKKWYEHTPLLTDNRIKVDADQLANSWLNDPTIGPLTNNPLLLSTLLMVHHLDGQLPNGRAQLYKRYTDGMLGLWDDRRQVSSSRVEITLECKRQILRGFALHLFFLNVDELGESDTLHWLNITIQNELKLTLSSEDVLYSIMERSGLIVGPGSYNFVHKTVAEYFVAEAILQGDRKQVDGKRLDRWYLFDYCNDDRWNTVIFLWAGMAPTVDVEQFIDRCIGTNNYPLALGLLEDQWIRFSIELRRQFILNIFSRSYGKLGRNYINHDFLDSNGYPIGVNINSRVPLIEIRSIGAPDFSINVLIHAINEGIITFGDMKLFRKGIQGLIWGLALGNMLLSADQIKYIMNYKIGFSINPTYRVFREVTSFISLLYREELSVENVANRLEEIKPEACQLLTLSLISTVLRHWDFEKAGFKSPISKLGMTEYISITFDALLYCRKYQINPDWLIGTYHWRSNQFTEHEILELSDYDLLQTFESFINQEIAKSNIFKNEIHKLVVAYINDLKNLRRTEFENI